MWNKVSASFRGVAGRMAGCLAVFILWLTLLLAPYDTVMQERLVREWINLLHVPMGFILTAWIFRCTGFLPFSRWNIRKRFSVTGLMAAIIPAIVEFIQGLVGRESSPEDFLLSMAGACLAGLVFAMRHHAGGYRWLIVFAWILVSSASVTPVIRAMNDGFVREDAFPVLASFEDRTELERWLLNGVSLSLIKTDHMTGKFGGLVSCTNAAAEYPGLFLTELVGNWTNAQALVFDVYWSGLAETNLEFRLDDQPGNPSYSERFQTSLRLIPGWNMFTMPLSDMRESPSGRCLQFDRIRQAGFFFMHAEPNDYLILDNIRLTLR